VKLQTLLFTSHSHKRGFYLFLSIYHISHVYTDAGTAVGGRHYARSCMVGGRLRAAACACSVNVFRPRCQWPTIVCQLPAR